MYRDAQQFSKKDALRDSIEDTAENITPDEIVNLKMSMDNRCLYVLTCGGSYIYH